MALAPELVGDGQRALTAPVKLTVTSSAAAPGRRRSSSCVAELPEGDDDDVEIAVARPRARATKPSWAAVSVASKATTSTVEPGASEVAGRRLAGRRPASTTVRVDGETSASTMARPMSLVPPSSTMVCGSPSAFSIGPPAQCEQAQPAALVAGPDAARVDGGRGRPATRRAGGTRGGSPPAWCGRPWRGSGGRRRRARGRRGRAAARQARRRRRARRAPASTRARGS